MEFKKNKKISTSDFWYDIMDGGYIDPTEVLKKKEDVLRVKEAIKVLQEFKQQAEAKDIIEYY